MERRDIPCATRIQSNQRPFVSSQFPNSIPDNPYLSTERLVARQLAWIGDQIELSRISAGRAGNIPKSIGRSLAAAGDLLDNRYNPFIRRNVSLLRLLCRGFSGMEDSGLVFAGALLQVCYLGLQQISQDILL